MRKLAWIRSRNILHWGSEPVSGPGRLFSVRMLRRITRNVRGNRVLEMMESGKQAFWSQYFRQVPGMAVMQWLWQQGDVADQGQELVMGKDRAE